MSNNNSYSYGRFKKTLLAASIMAISSAAYAAEPSKEKEIEEDEEQIEELVVTGRRHAIEAASEIKKNSTTIVDSIVADDAGRLPDNSITEVLQRIPGITMSRWNSSGDQFVVEGSGIQVRGLSNASSMLNGREIFGANGGSGLSWGEVTPELMAGVDVYKATRADMIEGGTGGSINLRTKMPFDYDAPALNGAVGLGYADLVDDVDGSSSILGTTRFDTSVGEMGILVDVAYSKLQSKSGHLSVEPYFKKFYDANGNGVSDGESEQRYITGGFGWGDSNFQRERTGFYEAFQWAPTENLTIFQTAFVSNYKSNNNGTSVWVAGDRTMPLDGSATIFDSNGVLVQADQMGYGSVGTGAGDTIGQGWIPEDQQVDCNTPYGSQAQSLNWGASPPNCATQVHGAGSSRSFSKSDNTTSDFSQGFTWHINERTRLRGALQYVYSTAESSGLSAGLSVPITTFSMDLRGDLPKFKIANSDTLLNPASYAWSQMSWRPTDNVGRMLAPNLDLDYDLGEGFFKTLSVGVRYADRYEEDLYDGTYWEPLGNSWNGWPEGQQYLGDGPEEDGEYYGFENFFHGSIPVPNSFYVPSEALMRSGDYNYLMNTYGYNIGKTLPNGQHPTTPFESLHVDHGKSVTEVDTSSFYIQTDFGSETGLFGVPYTGNMGVRYVRTDTKASGNFVFNASQFYMTQADANADLQADPAGELTPLAVDLPADVEYREQDSTDDRFLPTININFKPSDSFFIRAAANQSMARPYFGDITVAGGGSVVTEDNDNNFTEVTDEGQVEHRFLPIFRGLDVSTGNTTLKPTIATNFDLSFEWYGDHGSAAHVSFFHKSLEDLIIFNDSSVPFEYNFMKENGESVNGMTTLTKSQSINAEKKATINGFEFGARTYFDKLPGFWSGFGLDSNFTYIDSENPSPKSFDMEGNRFEDLPVTGLSKYSYNIQLMYQKGGFYAGLAWNWRSRFLMSTNANGTGQDNTTYKHYYDGNGNYEEIHYALPLYGSETGTLDFGMDYKFNDNFKIYFHANNLLNEVSKSEMEILPGKFYARNFYEADRRVDAGINFSF